MMEVAVAVRCDMMTDRYLQWLYGKYTMMVKGSCSVIWYSDKINIKSMENH